MSKLAPPIKVAIVGGGLAGISMANALMGKTHLSVQVFEAAADFAERGAAVALSTNAQRALECILPSAQEVLEKAGAVTMNPMKMMIGSGEAAGSLVCEIVGITPPKVVHRASLLRELLVPLPAEILHPNMKLSSIRHQDAGLSLSFHNGHVEYFDAVVGADGIFGSVRQHVVEQHECAPSRVGFWDCRNLVPYDKAISALGAEHLDVDRQNIWLGDGAVILHDVLENRTLVQCIVSGVDADLGLEGREMKLTKDLLDRVLCKWGDKHMADSIASLIVDQPNPRAFSQWHHKSTSTFAKGAICITGDAAHAASPWQGAGTALAIEDSVILGTLLGATQSRGDIAAAFQAFDAVRRPRCNRVVESSQRTGEISCGQDEELGLSPERLRDALMPRWAFIVGLDLDSHRRDALDMLNSILSR